MNQLIKTLALLFVSNLALTQTGPQILILSPNETKFESALDKELLKNVNNYKKSLNLEQADAFLLSDEFKKRPENAQIMTKSEIEYLRTLDHKNIVSYLAEQYLSYKLYEKFEGVVVRLKNARSNGSTAELKKIAADENTTFVLNFSAIELYKEKRQSFAKITVQLYDHSSGKMLLSETYTGGWENPGFDYACEEHSVNCCINNALSQIVKAANRAIIANDPTAKMQKQLATERAEFLDNNYLKKPFDRTVLQQIIPSSDKRIETDKAYQALFSSDQTKFVAFFAERVPTDAGMDFVKQKDDRRKNIQTEKEMDFFSGKIPNTYAYIVKGVKYEGKWYYEKAEVNYFNASNLEEGRRIFFCNLQEWNFFTDKSSAPSPEFWESSGKSGHLLKSNILFEKVTDIRQDPKWEDYKDMWETREQEDRPYIGMYEIVAEQLKEAKEASDKLKEQVIIDKYMIPLTDKLRKNYESVQLKSMSRDFLLIYPTDERVMLCPVSVKKNGAETLLYVILVKQPDNAYKTYEWTYVPNTTHKENKLSNELMDRLNSVTRWNYAYSRLNDDHFWNDLVLLKSDGNYQFLKEL